MELSENIPTFDVKFVVKKNVIHYFDNFEKDDFERQETMVPPLIPGQEWMQFQTFYLFN